jgi:hypothetical protein
MVRRSDFARRIWSDDVSVHPDTERDAVMLKAGDWVEVRSKDEILRSLDRRGRLDELPFMPQMFKYCGQRFRVFKRAHKTCDTVDQTGGRSLPDTVHLDLRCDGAAYGGCQAACLIFWKEAWLKPVDGSQSAKSVPATVTNAGCTEEDVWNAVWHPGSTSQDIRYACQATELPRYTRLLPWWDIRQYIEDYRSGNVSLRQVLYGAIYAAYYNGTLAYRDKIGIPARFLYDVVQRVLGGVPFPRKKGKLPDGMAVAIADLHLQPGELVRVKSYQEILATLDRGNKNRGLFFDAEMVPYCGRTFRVKARVHNFLNEKTGRMISLKTPAVMLENVWCQSRYSDCRMFCPRAIYSWWREVWLERVSEDSANAVASDGCAGGGKRQLPDAA